MVRQADWSQSPSRGNSMYKALGRRSMLFVALRIQTFLSYLVPSSWDWRLMAWALGPHHPGLNLALHLLAMR